MRTGRAKPSAAAPSPVRDWRWGLREPLPGERRDAPPLKADEHSLTPESYEEDGKRERGVAPIPSSTYTSVVDTHTSVYLRTYYFQQLHHLHYTLSSTTGLLRSSITTASRAWSPQQESYHRQTQWLHLQPQLEAQRRAGRSKRLPEDPRGRSRQQQSRPSPAMTCWTRRSSATSRLVP